MSRGLGDVYKRQSERSGIPVTVKSPDDGGTPEQFSYIHDYFSQLDRLVFTRTFTDPETGYRTMLDLDSYLRYFICQEIIGNADCIWSVHMYKERGDDLIHAGPLWDSELAFDNDSRVYPTNNLRELVSLSGRGPLANGMLNFHKRIFNVDLRAKEERSRIWSIARNENDLNGESLCAYIDYWAEQMKNSADLNFMRWDVLGKHIFTNPRAEKSFEEAVENLKTYISERIPRLDEKKFLNYDPEAASVILPVADSNSPIEAELVISGSCVSLANGGTFSIYTADGRLCFEGNGTTSPLASGVYIIRTPEGGSAKFSI